MHRDYVISTDEPTIIFKDATLRQKHAMVSLLLFFNRLDTTYKYSEDEIRRITTVAVTFGFNLGIDSTEAVAYFQESGLRQVLDDLRSLDDGMKTCYMLIGEGLYPSTQEKSGKIKATFGGYVFGLLSKPIEEYVRIVKPV